MVQPVLQVLGYKEVGSEGESRCCKYNFGAGGENEIFGDAVKIAKQPDFFSCKFVRFRLLLNDGDYSNSFVLLSSKVHIKNLSHFAGRGDLTR